MKRDLSVAESGPWRARRVQNRKAAIDNTRGNRQRTKWMEKVKLGHNNKKKNPFIPRIDFNIVWLNWPVFREHWAVFWRV